MDWDQIERNWQQAKQTIKRKWAKLTDEDLDSIKGLRDRLEDRIHKRYGFTSGRKSMTGSAGKAEFARNLIEIRFDDCG